MLILLSDEDYSLLQPRRGVLRRSRTALMEPGPHVRDNFPMRYLTSPPDVPVAEVWREAIVAASQEEQVLHVVRKYVESWTPDELLQLPLNCRPKRLQRANDVSLLVFKLQSAHAMAGGLTPPRREALERMLAFMETAMRQLALLQP